MNRAAYTLIELLITIAIIAILLSFLSISVLAARAAARRSACEVNLREIGIAVVEAENKNDEFFAVVSRGGHQINDIEAWRFNLLEYIDDQIHQQISSKLSQGEIWKSDKKLTVPRFVCPDVGQDHEGVTFGRRDYVAPPNIPRATRRRLPAGWWLPDPDSQTICVVEQSSQPEIILLNQPDVVANISNFYTDAVLQNSASWLLKDIGGLKLSGLNVNTDNLQGIYSTHYGGAHVLRINGSVDFISTDTAPEVLRKQIAGM